MTFRDRSAKTARTFEMFSVSNQQLKGFREASIGGTSNFAVALAQLLSSGCYRSEVRLMRRLNVVTVRQMI